MLISLWSGPGLPGYMSSTTQIPCCLSFRTKPDNKNVGSGQMLIRFPPGYGDTVNKAMAILSFICSQRE